MSTTCTTLTRLAIVAALALSSQLAPAADDPAPKPAGD